MDFRETGIEYISTDNYATFFSSETKWINKILKYHEQCPAEIKIIHHPENNDGAILAHIPKSWLKISPPKKVNLSEEQRAAARDRMASARQKKGAN